MYSSIYRNCYLLCYQKIIINNCSCYSPFYPSFNYTTPCLTYAQANCQGKLYNLVFDNIDQFCSDCPEECDSIDYNVYMSTSEFPSDYYVNYLLQNSFVKTKYPNINASSLKDSLVSFDVYYEDLIYTEITQNPQYLIIDFIAAIGGSFGLLMGASLISIIEVFELCAKWIFVLCSYRSKK